MQALAEAAPRTCIVPAGPINGTASTFNYLIDTILAIPDTRAMYLRRLRTLMDQLTGGQLASVSPLDVLFRLLGLWSVEPEQGDLQPGQWDSWRDMTILGWEGASRMWQLAQS